jgi:hypothetical protein
MPPHSLVEPGYQEPLLPNVSSSYSYQRFFCFQVESVLEKWTSFLKIHGF